MQNHLGPIRLRHKVRGAVGQGRHLVFLTVSLGHYDHRDEGQLPVGLHLIQEGVAIHHRHHHIQQDQGDAVFVLAQDFQRLLPVLRLQNFIFTGQYLTQGGPVQLVILYN